MTNTSACTLMRRRQRKKILVPFFFFNSCHSGGKRKGRGPLFLSLCTHVCLFPLPPPSFFLLPFTSRIAPKHESHYPKAKGRKRREGEARPSEGLPPPQKKYGRRLLSHISTTLRREGGGECERCFLKKLCECTARLLRFSPN